MLAPILLSLRVAAIATILAFFLGTFFAWLMTRRHIPLKNLWETILILPMILPPSVVGYFLLVLFGRRGPLGAFLLDTFGVTVVFTWIACVIAACTVSLPLMYQNAKGALLAVDGELEQAARTLGSREWKVFVTVTLPMARPGITSGIVLTFARAMGEFGATLMVAGNIPGKTQTMATAIYYAVQAGNRQQEVNLLVGIMTAFSFALILALNIWLKKKGGKQ